MTGYKLYRGTAPGVYGTPVTLLTAATSYTDNTCVAGTRYYYAVAALDAAGNEGAKSPEASAVALDNTPPAVPSGLAAVGGTKQVDLSWSANSESDLAGYNLYRNGVKVNTTPITATTYVDTGLVDGTTYSYRLSAVDTDGNESAQSGAVSATTLGEPPAPTFGTFEEGTDGAALGSRRGRSSAPRSAPSTTTPAPRTATLSGWIQGPAVRRCRCRSRPPLAT